MSTSWPAHSFHIAKLSKRISANWTSHYGLCQAAAFPTRPFLALRLCLSEIDCKNISADFNHILFLVSRQKPPGENPQHFFTLASKFNQKSRLLRVEPPLNSGHLSLYLHTSPHIPDDSDKANIPSLAHHLDEESFTFFREIMRAHMDEYLESHHGGYWTRADEVSKEYLKPRYACVFDSTVLEETRILAKEEVKSLTEKPSIYEEMAIFQQYATYRYDGIVLSANLFFILRLCADYSWGGVGNTIIWASNHCQYYLDNGFPRTSPMLPISVYTGLYPTFYAGFKKNALILQSMVIPHNGDLRVPKDDNDSAPFDWDWDEGLDDDLEDVPPNQPAVSASDIKVIAFDLLGTLLNRRSSLERGLRMLVPEDIASDTLMAHYIECESLRYLANKAVSYDDIVYNALKEMSVRLEIDVDDKLLQDATRTILKISFYPDALGVIKSLHHRGYVVVGLPLPLQSVYSLPEFPPELLTDISYQTVDSPEDLFLPTPSVFPALHQRCQVSYRDIQPAQILVVTASSFRTVEPATAAGFPTVLLPTSEVCEPEVDTSRWEPTIYSDDLLDLCNTLEASSSHISAEPAELEHPHTVAAVYAGYHVLSGNHVAIKMETPEDKSDEKYTVPYEAQVYKVFGSHPGVPRIRWAGPDGNVHALIMDRVGPTLEHLRRLCRGTFTHRTVTMLALQMLERVEFAHSRGIIIRDIKPQNFAMGTKSRAHVVQIFDFGHSKLYLDPSTGDHIPYREGLGPIGTPRFSSYNVHFGRESSRRDDMEAVGNTLLYFFHGSLPWQGTKAERPQDYPLLGEMKGGQSFDDFLSRSPPEFKTYYNHCRSLGFEDKPDYIFLKGLFQNRMAKERWADDGHFDWFIGRSLKRGTLLLDEYKADIRFVETDYGWIRRFDYSPSI
ncbi:kinase-like domain-containing protein [Hysterangium stoloniferum]|nr:kinase-like domain-containing protein [Hysterangium stoloniferum]